MPESPVLAQVFSGRFDDEARYGLYESERFSRECSAIEPDARRMDDVLDGVKGFVVRTPEHGKETDRAHTWAVATEEFPGAPALVIYYEISESDVTLLSIRYASLELQEEDD